jgi:hypothetical protein
MANSNDKYRLNYGASNYKPDRGRGSVSFGRVGTPVHSLSIPGRSYGSGVGVKVNVPLSGSGGNYKPETKKSLVEKLAKGGPTKKSGCEVKAYGDMIKKAAGGKVQTSSDTARKLATEMGGMKKGGVQKKALGGTLGGVTQLSVKQPAVAKPTKPTMPTIPGGVKQSPSMKQIADVLRGKTTPPPVAKPTPVKPPLVAKPPMPIVAKPPTRPTPKPSGGTFMPWDNKPPAEAEAILHKFREVEKTMKPADYKRLVEKYSSPATGPDPRMMAKGGAGKVRKGMMSPQGSILQAVKPKRGGM